MENLEHFGDRRLFDVVLAHEGSQVVQANHDLIAIATKILDSYRFEPYCLFFR